MSDEIEIKEAKSIVSGAERREILDATLDIAATTSAQQAKAAVAKAAAEHEKAKSDTRAKKAAWKKILHKLADETIFALPVTKTVISALEALTGVTPEPAAVWSSISVSDIHEDDEELTVTITAHSILSYALRWEDDNVDCSIDSDSGYSYELSLLGAEEVLELMESFLEAKGVEADTLVALEEAQTHRANHSDLVDAARVNLQRHKLRQLGGAGADALAQVDRILESQSDGDDFLSLM